ncbi:MAG: hypothetical protein R3C27_04975 [Hyphomonadaceae bacterium]
MASITPTQPAPEISPRAATTEPGPAAEVAKRTIAEHAAVQKNELMPDKVAVQLDSEAQRFVSTLTDNLTSEMIRRYPSESQLAYSRAVMAYLRAQIAK